MRSVNKETKSSDYKVEKKKVTRKLYSQSLLANYAKFTRKTPKIRWLFLKTISVKVIESTSFEREQLNRYTSPYYNHQRPVHHEIEWQDIEKYNKYLQNSKIKSQFLRKSSVKVMKTISIT